MRLSGIRVTVRACLIGLFAIFPMFAAAQERPLEVKPFLDALWPDAAERGITRKTFDAAFAGFTPDQRVIATTTRQPEYGTAVGTYVNRMASAARIEGAARKAAEWKHTLDAIEKQYGVDRWIILALWGIETSFGANTGGFDVIRSLATLSLIGVSPGLFSRRVARRAEDPSGRPHRAREDDRLMGRRDGPAAIHAVEFRSRSRSISPATAARTSGAACRTCWRRSRIILKHWGWKAGRRLGLRGHCPAGLRLSRAAARRMPNGRALGVKRADGKPLPADGNAILFFPSGASGPAFLVGENFEVIKRYNNSDVFALAAGHLADRARGSGPIRAAWPANDPQLSRGQRIALQKKTERARPPGERFRGPHRFRSARRSGSSRRSTAWCRTGTRHELLRDGASERRALLGILRDGPSVAALG